MSEVVKAEVPKALAEKFRKRALEIYGYRRGSMKRAIEDLMKRFIGLGRVDWSSLRGILKSELSSVELQHRAWREID